MVHRNVRIPLVNSLIGCSLYIFKAVLYSNFKDITSAAFFGLSFFLQRTYTRYSIFGAFPMNKLELASIFSFYTAKFRNVLTIKHQIFPNLIFKSDIGCYNYSSQMFKIRMEHSWGWILIVEKMRIKTNAYKCVNAFSFFSSHTAMLSNNHQYDSIAWPILCLVRT